MSELNLFNQPDFDGPCYKQEFDQDRLTGQIKAIFELMSDGKKRTLTEISSSTNYPESSVSAQLRHLRKDKFGNHQVEKQRRGEEKNGLWEYWLIINQSTNGHTP